MTNASGDMKPAAGSRYGRSASGSRLRNTPERERRTGVHQHARAGDEADQRLPARERQEADAADDERRDQADPRDTPAGGRLEGPREVAVAAQSVGDSRRPGDVDEAGASWRDDRVDVEDRREPADADKGRDLGERAGQRECRHRAPTSSRSGWPAARR